MGNRDSEASTPLGTGELYKLFFEASVRGGVAPLVSLAYQLLKRPIIVGDEIGALIVQVPDRDMDPPSWHEVYVNRGISQDSFLAVREEFKHARIPRNEPVILRGEFLYEGIQVLTNFYENEQVLGVATVNFGDDEPTEYDLKVCVLLSQALQPEMLAIHERDTERVSYLLSVLSEDDKSSRRYRLAVGNLTRKYPGDYRVHYIADDRDGGFSALANIKRRLNKCVANVVAVCWDHSLVILEHAVGPTAAPNQELAWLLNEYPVQAGMSSCFESAFLIPDYMIQARSTLEVGMQHTPQERTYRYEDYAPLQLFSICSEVVEPTVLVHPAVKRMVDYDAEHQSELVPTLEAYIDCLGSKKAAALELGIHVNTLAYRLQRIEELFDIDLANPQAVSQIGISLLAARFTSRV